MMQRPSVFFSMISIAIIVSASLQISIALQVGETCDGILVIAPAMAAGCLFGSFACTGAWIAAKRYQAKMLERLTLFCWTIVLSIGLVSVGAAVGQAQVYDTACPSLVSDTDFSALGLVSTILLILSVATPHGYKGKSEEGDEDYDTLTRSDTTDASMYTASRVQAEKPLVFL